VAGTVKKQQGTLFAMIYMQISTGLADSIYMIISAIYYWERTVMKRIITYGTFDLLHYGHINLLKRAKEQGDYLIVALSDDEFNEIYKHKRCYFKYEERKKLLESIRYVDLVIPETSWEQKTSDIKMYHIDVFTIGNDWQGKFDFLSELCTVIYFPRTPEISTSQIKNDLKREEMLVSYEWSTEEVFAKHQDNIRPSR
jgi:glycerol-3-phosphate cytidylyltransferase